MRKIFYISLAALALSCSKKNSNKDIEKPVVIEGEYQMSHAWLYSFVPKREGLDGVAKITVNEGNSERYNLFASALTELPGSGVGSHIVIKDSLELHRDGETYKLMEIRDSLNRHLYAEITGDTIIVYIHNPITRPLFKGYKKE